MEVRKKELLIVFISIILIIILLNVIVVSAIYSTDRTDYYFDGTYYVTDGIETDDIALNGNIPDDGESISSYGWSTESGCTYSNTKSSLGSLSVHCTHMGDNYRMMPANESFQGSWGMKVYIPCVGGSTWAGMKSADASGDQMQLYRVSLVNATHWSYGGAVGEILCDENSIPFICDKWTELMMEYIDANTVKAYVDGTLCHTFSGFSGIKFISMAEHSRDVNNAYFDEVWIANGDRPQEELDSDGDGITNEDDKCPGTEMPEEVPYVQLGINRFALTDDDNIFDTNMPNGKGPQKSFTLEDTYGCSCEQILSTYEDAMEGHWKYGCSISVMEEWINR